MKKKIDVLWQALFHRAFTGASSPNREVHIKELLEEMEEQTKEFNQEAVL